MAQIILDSNNNLIQGDFDNATLNNRTKLQTTTTNATTNVYVVPNGSSTSAGVSVANNSSLTNASKIVMATNGATDTQIISGVNGSGTYLPLSFYVNNALAVQYSTAGEIKLGAGAAAGTSGQVLTSGGAGAAVSWTTISSTPTTAQVGTASAGFAVGDLGTYAYLGSTTSNASYTPGTNVSGSILRYAGDAAQASFNNADASGNAPTGGTTTPSGTWKSMGQAIPNTANSRPFGSSIFLRIS
jgi:hypothetical protein